MRKRVHQGRTAKHIIKARLSSGLSKLAYRNAYIETRLSKRVYPSNISGWLLDPRLP